MDEPFTTSITLLGKLTDDQDQVAWSRFVDQYSPMIFHWCRRFGVQEKDAPDVTQEVMMKLLGTIKSFHYDPNKGNFRSWLKTITANLIRDIQRKNRPDVGSGDSNVQNLLNSIEHPKAFQELSEMLQRQYENELVAQANSIVKKRVLEKTWRIYEMAAIEQTPANQIATQIGVPIGEVYVAKSRVTKMLRMVVQELETEN